MMPALLFALLLPALAGCLAHGAPAKALDGGLAQPLQPLGLAVAGTQAPGGQPVRWTSAATTGTGQNPHANAGLAGCLMDRCDDPPTPCTAQDCERREIRIDVPDGWWGSHDGWLEFSIRWPTVFADWFQTRIEDASGATVAVGKAGYMGPFALVARLDHPAPGTYTAVLVHVSGKSPYEGGVQLESRPTPAQAHDLLPDLVTLPPTDLTLDDPWEEGPGYFTFVPRSLLAPLHRAAGSHGCATEEVAAESAHTCLRFSNAVGNLGEGPLEIHLTVDQGATSMAGGHFTQRVYRSDGTYTERPGGAAEFHAMHAHWHNAAANRYAVYHYDLANRSRGDLVNQGHKAGVCFADIGLVDLGLPFTAPGRFSGAPCLNPALSDDWYMGLSPNWYDDYYWILVDQYVEITGAPDGAYLLCSVTNQDHTLLESDYTDNEACTLFLLTGTHVKVLSAEPYHHTPEGANP
jgi:hypothetical protein